MVAIGLFGIALLLLGPDIVTQLPAGFMVAILLGTGGALLYMAVRKTFHTDQPYIGVQCFLMAAFFAHYALGGVLLWYWDSLPWQSSVNQNWFVANRAKENLSMAAYLAILGGLGLYCGSCLHFKSKNRPRWYAIRELGGLKRSLAPLAVVSFFLYVVVKPAAPTSLTQTVEIFASFCHILIVFVAFMAASSKDAADRWRWWIVCGLFYILLTLPSLRTGAREDFIKPLALIAIGCMAGRRRVPWKAGLVTLGAFIFVALPVLNLSKQYALEGNQSGMARLDSARHDVANRDYETVMEAVSANALARVNLLPSLGTYSRFYPLSLTFLHGETFLTEMIEFVPRLFWPEKPEVGSLLDGYARQVGIINAKDTQSSAKFDAISEYFINFGAAGVFVLSALHGAFYRLTEALLRRYVSPILAIFMIAVMMVQNNDFFSFVMLLPSHMKQVVVWTGIVVLVRRSGASATRRFLPARAESPVFQAR